MKKVIFLLILSVFLLSGCSSQNTLTNTQQTNTPVQTNSSVTIKNFSFEPSTLTVKIGTTVTWVNEDSLVHTIKSNSFNSGDLNQGDKFEFTFNTKGNFDYSCGIHPPMQGKIIVE